MAENNQHIVSGSEKIKKIVEGCKLAVKKLIDSEKKENGYLVISQNGKVVKIKAEDIK